jgi:hypothetical protein
MAISTEQALQRLDLFAANRDLLKQSLAETVDLLRTVYTVLSQDGGAIAPTVQRNITIIKLHIENEHDDQESLCMEQKEAIIATIQKIGACVTKGQYPSAFQRILSCIVGSPQEVVTTLVHNKKIILDEKTGMLSFHPEIVAELDYELFEAIIVNMAPAFKEQIKFFVLKNFSKLGPKAPGLLFQNCPNLSLTTFSALPHAFFDHRINNMPVNKGLLAAYSPYFRALWQNGMKESTAEISFLEDFDTATLKLLMGEKVETDDFHSLLAMAETLEKYGLLNCLQIERDYDTCMSSTFRDFKEHLHSLDAISQLLGNFAPLFEKKKLFGVQCALAELAYPLFPELDLFSPAHQKIIIFVAKTYESAFITYAIQVLQTHSQEPTVKNNILELQSSQWDSNSFLTYNLALAKCDSVRMDIHKRLANNLHSTFGDLQTIGSRLKSYLENLCELQLIERLQQLEPLLLAVNDRATNEFLHPLLNKILLTSEHRLRFLTIPYVQVHIVQIGYMGDVLKQDFDDQLADCIAIVKNFEIPLKNSRGRILSEEERNIILNRCFETKR